MPPPDASSYLGERTRREGIAVTWGKGKEEASHVGGLWERQAQAGPEPGGWEAGK